MTNKITKTENVMGIEINKDLASRLKKRLEEKNEDRIIEILEKVKYHKDMIVSLEQEFNKLTNL